MIILAQDKKNLLDCSRIAIEKNIGGKRGEKFFLVGYTSGIANLTAPMLGAYPDMESAVAEVERIYEAFANGASAYQIK